MQVIPDTKLGSRLLVRGVLVSILAGEARHSQPAGNGQLAIIQGRQFGI